jgi:hypothetical protein
VEGRSETVSSLRGAVLAIRFLCELAMLAALGYWGFEVGEGAGAWLLGIGAPALAIALWGAFVAPKARRVVAVPTRLAIELVLFGVAVVGLFAIDRPLPAALLGLAAGTTSLLNAATAREQPPTSVQRQIR